MGKLLLNLTPSEKLSRMKKLPYFDDLIELDGVLVDVICLGDHDTLNLILFDAIKIDFLGANCTVVSKVSKRGGKYGQSSSTLNTKFKTRKGRIVNSKLFSLTTLVMV
jgi:hypothetical protein